MDTFYKTFDWDQGQGSDPGCVVNTLCEHTRDMSLLWASVSPSTGEEGQTGDFWRPLQLCKYQGKILRGYEMSHTVGEGTNTSRFRSGLICFTFSVVQPVTDSPWHTDDSHPVLTGSSLRCETDPSFRYQPAKRVRSTRLWVNSACSLSMSNESQ